MNAFKNAQKIIINKEDLVKDALKIPANQFAQIKTQILQIFVSAIRITIFHLKHLNVKKFLIY